MSHICMLVCSHYPQDPRVRREAEALIEAGMKVDVICLRRPGQSARDVHGGVRIHRLPMDRKRAGKIRYIWDYALFMALSFAWITALHLVRRYRLIHVHNMPDVLVFCALVPRLFGARVILDLHDPTPEVYQTKFGIDPDGRAFRLLVALERLSIRFVHLALTPNKTFRDLFIRRGCPSSKIHVVMNSPQESIFLNGREAADPSSPGGVRDPDRPFTIMFHGGIYQRHGLDLALSAVEALRGRIPNLIFRVFGTGDFERRFLEIVEEKDLGSRVIHEGHVPIESIAAAIASIDAGLIPNRRTPFTEINLPTRIFEYLCLGKPAIVPQTRGILDYFDRDALFFFDPDRPETLAEAIAALHDDAAGREAILRRGLAVYREHTWSREADRFVRHVRELLGDRGPDASRPAPTS